MINYSTNYIFVSTKCKVPQIDMIRSQIFPFPFVATNVNLLMKDRN